MQTAYFYNPLSLQTIKAKILTWAAAQVPFCYLDNNEHSNNAYSRYELLVGVGAKAILNHSELGTAFDALETFAQEQAGNWLMGFLSYDLKNELEVLDSNNIDGLEMPLLHFFVPQIVIGIKAASQEVFFQTEDNVEEIWQAILATTIVEASVPPLLPPIKARLSKEAYLQTIEAIKGHIVEGDIYELNFCQEFYAEGVSLNPLSLFHRLNQISQAPFAAYYSLGNQFLLCASPERFLFKQESKLVSQPIKGTLKRGADSAEDALLSQKLYSSEKDRAENVMIVDLVRNDLARTCQPGSVQVEELFGIYAFKQVFQMISTIKGALKDNQSGLNALKAAFPMGSMTGAPKVMSMELIEQYELTKRGLYSGAVGYIDPNGDFDFNVVIRSLLYNAKNQYLSFQVGGAIVYDSIPELEYEECLLKAKGMLNALGL